MICLRGTGFQSDNSVSIFEYKTMPVGVQVSVRARGSVPRPANCQRALRIMEGRIVNVFYKGTPKPVGH